MGVTEEAGGIVRRSLAILSGAPMLLVLVLVNMAMFAMLTYLFSEAIQFRAKERLQIFQILENCYANRNRRS
jgi:hypothetical protein